MERRIYYNCHTHIFNVHVIPENILGNAMGYVLRALRFPQTDRSILALLGLVGIFSDNGNIERIKMFFREFVKGGQIGVAQHLINEYKAFLPEQYFRFVVLTQDMDCNGVEKPEVDIKGQIMAVSEIRCRNYSHISEEILPFVGINPFGYKSSEELLAFVKECIEERRFCGIKIYPASGYFADDEKLFPLWKYCNDKKIPIMTHCTCGPIYYRGNLAQRLNGKVKYPELSYNKVGQANFTDMDYFVKVLAEYEELKICFGHCGGLPEVRAYQFSANRRVGEIQNQWYEKLKLMTQEYPNVYCDISFLNTDKAKLEKVYKDYNACNLNPDRLLYGTDFFVNKHKTHEMDAYNRSKDFFDMDKICSANPSRYLTSDVYNAPEFINT